MPHDADWTYSVAVPPTSPWYQLKAVESYHLVHDWIQGAFERLGITTSLALCAQKEIPGQCFIGAEKSDVLWNGRKIAGAAQRRTRSGLLIQGSIQPPPIAGSRQDWQAALCQIAREKSGADWRPLEMTSQLVEQAANLVAVKYSQIAYNQKR